MGCADWAERVSAYVDEELTPAERGEVEKHLASCADCARAAEGVRKLSGLVRSLPRVAAPAGLREAVRATIAPAAEPKVIPFVVRHRAWLPTAAALVATLLLVYGFYSPKDALRESPPATTAREVSSGERLRDRGRREEPRDKVAAVTPSGPDTSIAAGEAGGDAGPARPAAPQPEGAELKSVTERWKSQEEDGKLAKEAHAQAGVPAPAPPAPTPPAAPGNAPMGGVAEKAKAIEEEKAAEAPSRRCEVEMLCADTGDAQKKVSRLLRDLRVSYAVQANHTTQVVVQVPANRSDELVEALNKLDASRVHWRVADAKNRGVAGKKSGPDLGLDDEKREASEFGAARAPSESRAANGAEAGRRGRLSLGLLLGEADDAEPMQKDSGGGATRDHASAPLILVISLEPQTPQAERK